MNLIYESYKCTTEKKGFVQKISTNCSLFGVLSNSNLLWSKFSEWVWVARLVVVAGSTRVHYRGI